MPGIFHQAGCCCGPCVDCAGYSQQNNAVVSISGSCGGGNCNAGGSYTPIIFGESSDWCSWKWRLGAPTWTQYLHVVYDKILARWLSRIYYRSDNYVFYGGSITFNSIPNFLDVSGLVSCDKNTSKLTGTFSLPGLNSPLYGLCFGCTAHVTI